MKWAPAVFALFLPEAASALSCVRPDVARDYGTAAAATETYVVVHGALSFDPNDVPERDLSAATPPPEVTNINGRLTGRALGRDGFATTFDQPVTIRLRCFAVWCGAPAAGDVLAFVERDSGQYSLSVDPCGSFTHPDPTSAQIDQVRSCFQGRDCTPASDR